MAKLRRLESIAVMMVLAACGGGPGTNTDSGVHTDGGHSNVDGGHANVDGGGSMTDGGNTMTDGGGAGDLCMQYCTAWAECPDPFDPTTCLDTCQSLDDLAQVLSCTTEFDAWAVCLRDSPCVDCTAEDDAFFACAQAACEAQPTPSTQCCDLVDVCPPGG